MDDLYDLTGTKMRIYKAANNNFEYVTNLGASKTFLQNQVGNKIDMATLFVDLVDSTRLSRVLSERKLTILMTSFAHEMAYLIEESEGCALKFVGDGVIGYFVDSDSACHAARCAKGMLYVTKCALDEMFSEIKGIEEEENLDKLAKPDYNITTDEQDEPFVDMDLVSFPDFKVRVGLNYGTNMVVRYGRASQDSSVVDLIGYPLNLTAKIQAYADPSEVLAGEHLYDALPSSMQGEFVPKQLDCWKWCHPGTDNKYKLYSLSL